MNRRHFITGLSATTALFWASGAFTKAFSMEANKNPQSFPFQLTDEQWKKRLTPDQYRVLRTEGTEASCSSPLLGVEGHGKFYCAGCGYLLFSTDSKFDSKTGWPSFYKPVDDNAVGTSTDYKLGYARTEVHCANCGGHLGHVFNDGPPPTGLRYCINGVAMDYAKESD